MTLLLAALSTPVAYFAQGAILGAAVYLTSKGVDISKFK